MSEMTTPPLPLIELKPGLETDARASTTDQTPHTPPRTKKPAGTTPDASNAPGGAAKHPSSSKARSILLVDPARVRVGTMNPRVYSALNEDNCRELMRMIAAVGQLSPVLVRKVTGDRDHDYEIVAGNRRHWSVTHLRRTRQRDLLIKVEVVDYDDREAARVIDAENRGRAGISAHERALFVAHQLEHSYGGDRAQLAADMRIEPGLLSRLLALAAWPRPLVDAWGDQRAITVEDTVAINPILADDTRRDALLAAARAIAAEQEMLQDEGQRLIRPTAVRRRLIAAASPENRPDEFRAADGKLAMTIRGNTRNGISLYIHETNPETRLQIIAAVQEVLAQTRTG